MTSVDQSGVTTMPLGKSMSPATCRVVPSGATMRIHPGVGSPPPAKSKSAPFTKTRPAGSTTTSLPPCQLYRSVDRPVV